MKFSRHDVRQVFARTLWGEARGQGTAGMRVVACVILNRDADRNKHFGQSILDICLAPRQFSCWNWDDANHWPVEHVTDRDPQYRMALDVVEEALTGCLKDTTHGANYYLSHGARRPVWLHNAVFLGTQHRFDLYKMAVP